MATPTIRLHGEDGEVYAVSAKTGEKLWLLRLVDIDISQKLNSVAKIDIHALGVQVGRDGPKL